MKLTKSGTGSILAVGFSEEKQERLRQALQTLALPVLTVPAELEGLTVGEIAETVTQGSSGSRIKRAAPDVPVFDLLLFQDLTEEELDRALALLRAAELSIPFKAILTPVNRNWTPAYLFRHLMEERAQMAKKR